MMCSQPSCLWLVAASRRWNDRWQAVFKCTELLDTFKKTVPKPVAARTLRPPAWLQLSCSQSMGRKAPLKAS